MTKLKSKAIKYYEGKVYDLEIEHTSSYNISSISVHNSASGCLLSWILDITTIDSILFSLYFERFLNPTRKAVADIDLDVMSDTEGVIKDYLYKKYGRERVLNVAAFSTFSEKGTLKDVVRVHLGDEATGFQSDAHAVTQEMPNFDKVEYSLKDWFQNWPLDKACSPRVAQWLRNPENTTILHQTVQLQGSIKGISQHAAGIVITPGPSWEYIPTNMVASSKSVVTAFQEADKSGKDLSELKILKLDVLKISSLNQIVDAIKFVKEHKGIDISDKVYNVDLYDKNLYDELRLGVNFGIFQYESSGMQFLIKSMMTDNFEELVAANALYRPGPMGIKAHEEYVKNKFNPKDIKYVHPALASILDKTNGVLIFQEQLMFLANKIGGMSLGEGDQLRRYMDKASQAIKKKAANETMTSKDEANYKEFEKYWNKFLDGASKNGYKPEEIDPIKTYLASYLGYSFNRCLTENHTVRHREKGVIPISEVQPGDYILGYNPEIQQDEYNMVKKIHHNGVKPVFKATTDTNKVLECTMDHKVLTEAGMVELKNVIEKDLSLKTL